MGKVSHWGEREIWREKSTRFREQRNHPQGALDGRSCTGLAGFDTSLDAGNSEVEMEMLLRGLDDHLIGWLFTA